MFSLTGQVNGTERTVSWMAPDHLAGDEVVVRAALEAVRTNRPVCASPTSKTRRASLVEPFDALLTLLSVFDGGVATDYGGDLPSTDEPFDPAVIY